MPQDQLTVRFYGLCLFTTRKSGGPVTVYLAQPACMQHLPILRYPNSGKKWSAIDIPAGATLEFGKSGNVTMPPDGHLSDVVTTLDPGTPVKTYDELDAIPGLTKVKLSGGALSVKGKIGIWKRTDRPGGPYHFPNRVEWSGPVALNQHHGVINVWNAVKEESPKVSDDSPFPNQMVTKEQAKERSAMHFKAYYQLLGTTPIPVEWTEQSDDSPNGDPTEELKAGPLGTLWQLLLPDPYEEKSLIVSSCPSAQAELA